jgi:hypothetical protein
MSCIGCGSLPTAALSYVHERREAWLGDFAALDIGDRFPLCDRHADGVRPPPGWVLHDRRRARRAEV